ncbi:MAG: ATP-binding cassette domain-containing protein, partial [Burkholderiaceae bacterium]
VKFRYSDQHTAAIDRVSLSIPAKSMVAFIGESGAGKSTLADVITGRLTPNEGEVSIDDKPLGDVDMQSWRKQIGYVSQETIVFDDTIENNISMWGQQVDDDQALTERVIRAAKQSFLHDYIINLPQGYKTLVGERGMRLSGGQRQRLFIARELFRSPNLLILDEATSALDSESERVIQKNIDNLKGQISVIVIAHRLSTIKNADLILVMEEGNIVEQGTHKQLIDSNGHYAKLYNAQFDKN